MSSAKKGESKFVLCLHISKFAFDLFYRAKPVSEMERSGIERHCGPWVIQSPRAASSVPFEAESGVTALPQPPINVQITDTKSLRERLNMGIIKAVNLIFNYVRHDEEDNTDEVTRALKGVSLDINEGSFVAILGHNGSGKSTFAKLMNGILLPSEGTVYISDMNTSDEEHLWDVRKTAGMVFQNPDNQIIGNVVEEDVGFGPENMGVPTEEIWERVDKSLEAVGMTAYRLQSPNKLSGGQKQRVAIAGVMAMKPRCIVLDEPTAMLDPNGRAEVIKTVHELNQKEGITVLLITHYMEEVIDADRVIVMDEGRVVMDGTPKDVFSNVKELKKYSLDVPQVTELADELKAAGMDIPNGILTISELVSCLVPLLSGEEKHGN